MRRGRQPSPELRHATSDDNLSSSTGEGPSLQATWTRPHCRQLAAKNQTPREADFEARRKKRRSRSFEVTGQAVSTLLLWSEFHVFFTILVFLLLIIYLIQFEKLCNQAEATLYAGSSFLPPLARSCLKPRQPRLRGSVLWTARQTPTSTITARPPCSAPCTEGSLLSPKSEAPTAASNQVSPPSLLVEPHGFSFLTFNQALFLSPL